MGTPPGNLAAQKQIAALRAENERLRRLAPSDRGRHRASGLLRSMAITGLVGLSVIFLAAANLFFWFGNTVVKQDRFVAATQPIIKDPAVQGAMSLYITNTIFSNTDVQDITTKALPPRAEFLAPQLTQQLRTYTESSLQKIFANQDLQDKWNQVLATQHQRLVSFASKYQGDGVLTVNDVYQQATAKLSDTRLSFLADKQLPAKAGQVTLISAAWLPAFHNLVVNIDTWRLLSLVLLVAFVALAVWMSRSRRHTLYIFSSASAIAMLATLVGIHLLKNSVTGKVNPAYADGVGQALNIVSHSLVLQTITIMSGMLFISLVSWISGPATAAARIRGWSGHVFAGNLHGRVFKKDGKLSGWVREHSRLLEWSAVALVALIMLLVQLTLLGIVLYSLLLLLLILTIEFVGGGTSNHDG